MTQKEYPFSKKCAIKHRKTRKKHKSCASKIKKMLYLNTDDRWKKFQIKGCI